MRKPAIPFLILSAALLAAAMLFRSGCFASQPQPAEAARPVGGVEVLPDPRIGLHLSRKAAKEEVARRLFDGELTLLEAAERFRLLKAGTPSQEDLALKSYPGGDDGERTCNQLIAWTEAVASCSHPRAAVEARVAVLRRELQDHVARHGGVSRSASARVRRFSFEKSSVPPTVLPVTIQESETHGL